MKQFLLAASVVLCLTSCEKCKNAFQTNPSETLPPYTDTGANTFGCLVDGNVFRPNRNIFSTAVELSCDYQIVNGYPVFGIGARDFIKKTSVGVGMNRIYLTRDTVIQLVAPGIGVASGYYADSSSVEYGVQNANPGTLNILHFDSVRNIVAGTFWFDAVDTASGKVVQVRDGRFDVHFTR